MPKLALLDIGYDDVDRAPTSPSKLSSGFVAAAVAAAAGGFKDDGDMLEAFVLEDMAAAVGTAAFCQLCSTCKGSNSLAVRVTSSNDGYNDEVRLDVDDLPSNRVGSGRGGTAALAVALSSL